MIKVLIQWNPNRLKIFLANKFTSPINHSCLRNGIMGWVEWNGVKEILMLTRDLSRR